ANMFENGGVYRSKNKGRAFTRLSGDGLSGLPDQGVSSLVADPGNSSIFYAAVPTKSSGNAFNPGTATGSEGVYKSTDGGLTWTAVNTGLTGLNTSGRILLAAHNNALLSTNAVYAMVIGSTGKLSGVFRSPDQGANWTSMSVPSPDLYPGSQGMLHGAIVADPTDANVVFIAGDRQASPFPNSNGCSHFSMSMFRGDALLLPGNPWANVVCNGANGTSPHPDARAMAFDANGDILQVND